MSLSWHHFHAVTVPTSSYRSRAFFDLGVGLESGKGVRALAIGRYLHEIGGPGIVPQKKQPLPKPAQDRRNPGHGWRSSSIGGSGII
jgi:hypothetical protein